VSGDLRDLELHNLTDLGGIATPRGPIRPGRLFRSANPDRLTVSGWRELQALGIRSIVDLRNDYEPIETVRPPELVVARRPIEDQSDAEFMAACGDRLGSPEYYPEVASRWPELIGAAISAIADAPAGGVLIHCMAGRDRTGMIAALVLDLLGVDRDTVFADFSRGAREINAWWAIHGGPQGVATDEQLGGYLVAAKVTLNAFLDAVDSEQYLRAAGVTDEQLTALRSRLLDPGFPQSDN
jgi:hypothetical protein